MKSIIIVAAGSGLGGVLRYGIQLFTQKVYPSVFPAGTFAVNIIGCFLIGIFFTLAEKENFFSPATRLFLVTGLCGGFTTFSSFAIENVLLLRSGNLFAFFLYVIGSTVTGLSATFLGIYLSR